MRVLGGCIIAWCLMTIACGFATGFHFLPITRSGLAIAEAAVPIAVLSILADRVPRTTMPTAGALFVAGPYIGGGLAWPIGRPLLVALEHWRGVTLPMVGAFEPWRAVFWIIGAPGIFLGIAILRCGREPSRRDGPVPGSDRMLEPVWPYLRDHWRFLLPLVLFLSSLDIVNMTIYAWTPSFRTRVHQMDPAESGLSGCLFCA